MGVGGGHFLLFGIGHRQDAQGQDLVDLGAVEQIARAFRGDLRVVVENDRRGQHRVAVPLAADQHRPGPLIDAGGRGLAQLRGRVDQRQKRAIAHAEDRVGRGEGEALSDFAVAVRPRGQGVVFSIRTVRR